MLCDLLTASIDFHFALKEKYFEGWLDERLDEIKFINKKLNEIDYAERAALESTKQILIQDITSRCIVNKQAAFLNNAALRVSLRELGINNWQNIDALPEDKRRDEEIQKKLDKTFDENRSNLIIKTLSFVGMTLSAIAAFFPPVTIAATIICSFVALCYFYKRIAKPVVQTTVGYIKKRASEKTTPSQFSKQGAFFQSSAEPRTDLRENMRPAVACC